VLQLSITWWWQLCRNENFVALELMPHGYLANYSLGHFVAAFTPSYNSQEKKNASNNGWLELAVEEEVRSR